VLKVASPVYKNSFCLRTGQSLDKPEIKLPTYPVRVVGGRVQVRSEPSGPEPTGGLPAKGRAPLAGRTVAIGESREAFLLSRMLGEKGAGVVSYPLVRIVESPDVGAVERFVRELAAGRFDALVLVTGEGVRWLMHTARRVGLEPAVVAALRSA